MALNIEERIARLLNQLEEASTQADVDRIERKLQVLRKQQLHMVKPA